MKLLILIVWKVIFLSNVSCSDGGRTTQGHTHDGHDHSAGAWIDGHTHNTLDHRHGHKTQKSGDDHNSLNHDHDHNSLNHDHDHDHKVVKEERDALNQTSIDEVKSGQNQTMKPDDPENRFFIREIFNKYGDANGLMTFEGFEHLLESIGIQNQINDHNITDHYNSEGAFQGSLHNEHDHHKLNSRSSGSSNSTDDDHHSVEPLVDHELEKITSNHSTQQWSESIQNNIVIEKRCLSASELMHSFRFDPNEQPISHNRFLAICPALIYELDQRLCAAQSQLKGHSHSDVEIQRVNSHSKLRIWLYATGSVLFISVVGLMCVLVIPLIQQNHYEDMIQLLVGLAIGTLVSDALLHLLPHAFSEHDEVNDHGDNHDHDNESAHTHSIKNVAYGLMALVGIVGFLAFERGLTIISDLCNSRQKSKRADNFNNNGEEKKSNHGHSHLKATHLDQKYEPAKIREENTKPLIEETIEIGCLNPPESSVDLATEQCHRETVVYQHPDADLGYVVELTDHHHHHQHQPPQGLTSIVYMIITGDGLHNFFDGLAIGVAFATGLGGGLSTSIAVLCHELPHEIGDFAVLFKAGLTAKKAIMYNTISSVLCFIGMTVGLSVGHMDTGFISSIIAGMFIYIALVDMIPQLDCCPTQAGTVRAYKLLVQLIGVSIGISIMTIISIYEGHIQVLLS